MAKSPAKTDAAEGPRTFSFEPTFSLPIPEVVPQRASELPFKDYFSKVEKDAKEGKEPHLFLPHAFWTAPKEQGGRGVPKMNPSADAYAKSKVRDQFNAWKKQDSARAKLTLVLIARSGSEGIEGITEAGISFWVTNPR
jgi:hypothetical protein